jgi:hypothetical protein
MKFSIYFLFINFLIIKIAFADSSLYFQLELAVLLNFYSFSDCNLGGIDSCQNGGSCSNQDDENDDDHNVQTGTCKCKAGYTGSTCATCNINLYIFFWK